MIGVAVMRIALVGPTPPPAGGMAMQTRQLAELLRAEQATVLLVPANSGWSWHLFAAPAVWVARSRQVPVVVNYRRGEAADFLKRSSRLVRVTMRRAARLVVPSSSLKDVFGQFGMVAEIVPNTVDRARFSPTNFKRGLSSCSSLFALPPGRRGSALEE